jgi:hypothetical protein
VPDLTKFCEWCNETIKYAKTPKGKDMFLNLYREIVSEHLRTQSMFLINNTGEAILINDLKEKFQMAYTEHKCLIYKKTFTDAPMRPPEKLPPADKFMDPVAFAMNKWKEHRATG